MIPEKRSVGERITIYTGQTDRFKASMLSLSVVLPIHADTAYLTSLLWSVLLRGTRSYPSIGELNRRLDYLFGAELSVEHHYRGNCHVLGLSVNLLAERYLPAQERPAVLRELIALLGEILFSPATDGQGRLLERYVESEKRLQCDAIRAKKNHPSSYAADRARAILYEGEPAGVPMLGSEEQVMAVTVERLCEHWRWLLSELSLYFYYIGDVEPERLSAQIRDVFADRMPAGRGSELPVAVAPLVRERACVRAEESLPIRQGHLVMGLRGAPLMGEEGFYAAAVFNELFGLSPISRLFMHVREKLSLCYSCSSAYGAYRGTVLISVGLCNESREAAEREILAQLLAVARGDFTDAELQAAIRSLENGYRQLGDSPGAMRSYYFGRMLAGVEESFEACRRRFADVTREDVMAIAAALTLDTVFFLRGDGQEGEEDDDDGE